MGLTSIIITLLDPFAVLRKMIVRPITTTLATAFSYYRTKTSDQLSSAKEIALKASIIAITSTIIIWTAVFMYIAFYYTFIPAIAHTRPVHLQFEPCTTQQNGQCSFPHAYVSLTKRQQLLMVGQPYRVFLAIEMPDSPQNQNIGMFMVCAEMRDQLTKLRDHSCRAAMLHYKSTLIRTISTIIMSPLYIMGIKEESQQVFIELFTNYEDDQSHPATDVFIELQTREIQYYSITLHITAHFSGLRYIMFHWPMLSATIGICTNLFVIIIVTFLSWYHWGDYVWFDAKQIFQSRVNRQKRYRSEFSTSIDESSKILDDEDIISLDDEQATVDQESRSETSNSSGSRVK